MKKVARICLGSKTRVLVTALVTALIAAGGALAWVIFTGGSGSTTGTITSNQTISSAVTFESPTAGALSTFCALPYQPCGAEAGNTPVDPGGSAVNFYVGVKNLSGVNETVTIDPTKITFSSTGSSGGNCGAHLHLGTLTTPLGTADNSGALPQPIPHTLGGQTAYADDGNGNPLWGFKAVITGDSSMPSDCKSAAWTMNIPANAVTTAP